MTLRKAILHTHCTYPKNERCYCCSDITCPKHPKRDEIIDAIGRGNTTSIKSFERFDAKDNKRR